MLRNLLQLPESVIREYKSFIFSHYVGEGIRITAGLVFPAVIFSYFGMLEYGIVMSLGALATSIPDSPGPMHHRKNAMIICLLLISFGSFITGILNFSPLLLGIWIAVASFLFSIIGVFNTRSMAIGSAVLLVMVLTIDQKNNLNAVLLHSALVLAGGVWYAGLSLLLYSIRPYKLTQQVLGDCIESTAAYLRVKASFYKKDVDYDASYRQLLEEQIHVHQHQELVRDLLFKSRYIVRESTPSGRILVMIFLDIVDLFERSMTAHQDYKKLHESFDAYRILPHFNSLIVLLGDELHRIGIALKMGYPSTPTDHLSKEIEKVNIQFNALRDQERNSENIESFISLRHILNSIEDIAARIYTLHRYTTFDPDLSNQFKVPVAYDNFVTHSAIDFRLLRSSLTLRSSNFRHALRVSIAMLTGFIVSLSLPFGHSYWILLTIIVIIRPGYSQTKNRSYERLLGTIAGAALGFIILYFVHDKNSLLTVMILCMIGTFSFMRFRYIVGVVLMTPYVLILFHLLFGGSSNEILYERVIDTAIGSAIAFLANYLLVPNWAHTQLKHDMAQAIHDNSIYLKDVAGAFAGKTSSINEFKLARKNAFVSQANLTDSFNKMLSEPNDKKKHSKEIHQFVVLNHMLTSHIATVSYYVQPLASKYQQPILGKLTTAILKELDWIEAHLLDPKNVTSNKVTAPSNRERDNALNTDLHISDLMKQLSHEVFLLREARSKELEQGIMDSSVRKQLSEYKSIADQFLFIARTSAELQKNVRSIHEI